MFRHSSQWNDSFANLYLKFASPCLPAVIVRYSRASNSSDINVTSFNNSLTIACSRISSNIGVISKLRHYLSIHQLKQLYYNLIYPYLSYAIIAWGSAYKTHLKRLQSKQNTVLRLMFFATTSGPYTESALSFLNLLDVLTVNNVYRLHALKFTHLRHKGHLPSLFDNLFQYASYRHTRTIQGMRRSKTSVNRVLVLTLENKCFPIRQ